MRCEFTYSHVLVMINNGLMKAKDGLEREKICLRLQNKAKRKGKLKQRLQKQRERCDRFVFYFICRNFQSFFKQHKFNFEANKKREKRKVFQPAELCCCRRRLSRQTTFRGLSYTVRMFQKLPLFPMIYNRFLLETTFTRAGSREREREKKSPP